MTTPNGEIRPGDYVTAQVIGGIEDGYSIFKTGYFMLETSRGAIIAFGDAFHYCYPRTLSKVPDTCPLLAKVFCEYADEMVTWLHTANPPTTAEIPDDRPAIDDLKTTIDGLIDETCTELCALNTHVETLSTHVETLSTRLSELETAAQRWMPGMFPS